MIYYDDILYLCENCGWDELNISWRAIHTPPPTKYYTVLVCRVCGTEHVRREWQPLLRAAGLDGGHQ